MHAFTTGVAAVAAATLTATTAVPATVPAAKPAVRATATPGIKAATASKSTQTEAADVESADTVQLDAATTAVVEAAVAQASGALAHAELVTTEGSAATIEAIAQIEQAKSVVRELVRRASTEDATVETPDAAVTSASADDVDDAAEATDTSAAVTSPDQSAVDPAIQAAADAAVTSAIDAAAVTSAAAADKETVDGETAAGGEGITTTLEPGVVATALEQQTAALAELVDATFAVAVTVTPAPPTPEEIAAQQAAEAAADAARLAALAEEAKQYSNGQIPDHVLAEIPWAQGERLRADATAQLARLNEAFRARFGIDLGITDSYRSYADQVAVKQARGSWAAVPGYSNHGFGIAVDLGTGIASSGSAEYQWMRENAPAFGWVNPEWAQPGGRMPEAWHWEFVG